MVANALPRGEVQDHDPNSSLILFREGEDDKGQKMKLEDLRENRAQERDRVGRSLGCVLFAPTCRSIRAVAHI